jgi:hypothetical protein
MTHRPRTSIYEWKMAAASDIGSAVTRRKAALSPSRMCYCNVGAARPPGDRADSDRLGLHHKMLGTWGATGEPRERAYFSFGSMTPPSQMIPHLGNAFFNSSTPAAVTFV